MALTVPTNLVPDDTQDLSYLGQVSAAGNFIADVKVKIKEMKRLQLDMVAAEAAYHHARDEYERYKSTVVIATFVNAGIEQIQDDDGNIVKLESKFYLKPNKNDDDRIIIENWLKANGGEHLLKHEAHVSAEQIDKLKEADIPFADKTDVNTNSLKAHILDLLGYKKGGIARIKLEDIPDCFHFVVAQELEVK